MKQLSNYELDIRIHQFLNRKFNDRFEKQYVPNPSTANSLTSQHLELLPEKSPRIKRSHPLPSPGAPNYLRL